MKLAREWSLVLLPVGFVQSLPSVPSWSAESDQARASFGVSVAPAGDVNGDGYGDVLVGAHRFDGGETDEGRVDLYLGSATGLALFPAWTVESDQAGARLGASVALAGDVNADGYGDVLVSAWRYESGQATEGRAYAYLGSAAGLATSAAWTAEGDQVDALFGSALGAAGDVNGDGYSDVLVGAFRFSAGEVEEGRVFAYHGSAEGLSTSAGWTGEGGQAGAHYGNAVSFTRRPARPRLRRLAQPGVPAIFDELHRLGS